MQYDYNLEDIKNNLTIEQVLDIVAELGGEPKLQGDTLLCRTICHGGDSHKLYYWDNTHLFRCFTQCGETFDIFELVRKVKSLEMHEDYQLPQAIEYVANFFGFSKETKEEIEATSIDDYLVSIAAYDRINNIDNINQVIELKEYDDTILKNLPHDIDILPWIEDNITSAAMKRFEICYEPKNNAIVIPHRSEDGKLIGIRQRTLITEQAEKYGKYMPLKLGNKMYNHPLSFALYGLYQNKENIKRVKKAIVLESEKSVLQLDNILTPENNIGVACCGSNLIAHQVQLLLNLGVEEIIIAFDHDFRNVNEDTAARKIRNLKILHKKYGNYIKLSFIWDKNGITGLKASPTDCGKAIFMQLLKERINIY